MKGVYAIAWMLTQIVEKEIDILIRVTPICFYGEIRTCHPIRNNSEVIYWCAVLQWQLFYAQDKLRQFQIFTLLVVWEDQQVWPHELWNKSVNIMVSLWLQFLCTEREEKCNDWGNENRNQLELFYMDKGNKF